MALIEIKNLIKTYSTGETSFNALNGVSLNIENGEFVAIMGASGSGKSTFMNMLGCLDKPTSGSYFLDGIDVSKMSMDELSEIRNLKLGFVFQGFNLISRTSAIENVEMPMIYKGVPQEERIKRAKAALKIVGLEAREQHLPNQMSGGQQQRVAIARAIVNDAPIILADEPTGNLDTKTSIEVMEFFVKLNAVSGKTIILVTHEPDIAEYCKRVVRFQGGNIISDTINEYQKGLDNLDTVNMEGLI
jgi:putative ABC transport system ATP-binding protein